MVLWGARTHCADAYWQYLAVRRLAILIESSIRAGTRWVADQPNGHKLWAEVRAAVETFLAELRSKRALQGINSQEAFFVRCDPSTMSPRDLSKGLVVCQVGFAPLRPGEFIEIRIPLIPKVPSVQEPVPISSSRPLKSRTVGQQERLAMKLSRRDFLRAGVGAALLMPAGDLLAQSTPLLQKKIPSSGEMIPIIGLGTARRYEEINNAAEKAPLRDTILKFKEVGLKVIDSSPSYGTAEAVVGEIVEALKVRDSLFLATKVSLREIGRAQGMAQIEQSFKRLRTDKIDLIAVHNLRDTQVQLQTLREMKKAGRIRYVGVTTSFDNQYGEFEQMMKKETLDFIQVDYALDNRDAGERLIPLAGDRGMAVMINLPFGRGRLFNAVQGKKLPEWASEFDCASWAQFFSSISSLIPRLRGRPGNGQSRICHRQSRRGTRPLAGCGHAHTHGTVITACER